MIRKEPHARASNETGVGRLNLNGEKRIFSTDKKIVISRKR